MLAGKLGFHSPPLTAQQVDMPKTRWIANLVRNFIFSFSSSELNYFCLKFKFLSLFHLWKKILFFFLKVDAKFSNIIFGMVIRKSLNDWNLLSSLLFVQSFIYCILLGDFRKIQKDSKMSFMKWILTSFVFSFLLDTENSIFRQANYKG